MYSSVQATRTSMHHESNVYVHNRLGSAIIAVLTGAASIAAMLFGYYAASSYEMADSIDILAISISFLLAFCTLPFGLAALYSSKGKGLAIIGLVMSLPGLLLFFIPIGYLIIRSF